jgi:hypothetical protein
MTLNICFLFIKNSSTASLLESLGKLDMDWKCVSVYNSIGNRLGRGVVIGVILLLNQR